MSRLSFQCRHRYASGFELDVEFETVERVTALFGPSGSGKTSVLSMIAGFVRPTVGRIVLGERTLLDTQGRSNLPPEERNVGLVFQDHLLFPHLTVEANLRYGQRRTRRGTPIDFDHVVRVLALQSLLARRPRHLSGGERQRVSLGRALLRGPALLLMDEPLSSLDEDLQHRILSYLERVLHEWSIPVLLVSHDQAAVRWLSREVIVLSQGKVIARGTPDAALSQPELLSWKNAVGPMNLLRIESAELRDGQWVGQLGPQRVYLPPLEAAPRFPLFVQFSPGEVTLSRHGVAGLSVRNQLHGRVRQVLKLPGGVFVAIDVGQVLWAQVTSEAADELALETDAEVTCLIKTHSLRVLG